MSLGELVRTKDHAHMTRFIVLLLCLFAELTTEDRRRYGRIGAYIRLSRTTDRTAMTAPGRAAGPNSLDWHAKRIDPEGKLPPEQRAQMAEAARTAWYLALSEKSRKARAARKADQEQA